ncbi:GNAT family N-acetyltransferase [Marinomonas rhizomae]|uniref:L-amino acid N-acyltransferase YncA n=1 Tax=Marinomonas rhizomae TaxID=491948 RepID=A0A366J4D0_9GAMM|nr:GNAT family N-acetyltransferase [Marinomonas rhizomae]RBP81114.1 L-amino acid N-acyltransferase YncA [Marinomonas rhizomae]RNF72273.1 GNAT family N-acetyltransferase [Marinomonas rhizomae]
MFSIRPADFPQDNDSVLAIFREYIMSAPVSLDYQQNEQEFIALDGKYSLPNGVVLLIWKDNEVVGCGAFRRVDAEVCEMKRVYVRPTERGHQLGEKLVIKLMQYAKESSYQRMCLDVLADFDTARRLYVRLGFEPCDPVSYNPIPGTHFLGRNL